MSAPPRLDPHHRRPGPGVRSPMDVDTQPAASLPGADAEPEERLWKHRNGRWYILFGPRLKQQLSTGTKDRAEAERELAAFRLGRAAGGISGQTVGEILDGYEREKLATVRSPGGIKYS